MVVGIVDWAHETGCRDLLRRQGDPLYDALFTCDGYVASELDWQSYRPLNALTRTRRKHLQYEFSLTVPTAASARRKHVSQQLVCDPQAAWCTDHAPSRTPPRTWCSRSMVGCRCGRRVQSACWTPDACFGSVTSFQSCFQLSVSVGSDHTS